MCNNLLCITPDLDSPFIINLRQPFEVLKGSGALTYSVVKEKDATIHDVFGHDAVLFFRTSAPALLKLLYFAKLAGKPVIFAVDDNFFELAQSEIGAMDPVRLGAHERFIREADKVMVYSNPMMERVSRLNKNAVKMAPGMDFSVLEGIEKRTGNEKTRVVYATWRNKRDILSELFIPAVKKILLEYGGRVEMHFWGYAPEELNGLPGFRFMPRTDYDIYIRRLYSEGFDIGLAPLKDDEFHRSKTNTKFRDYGACGIAGIYSNVDVYSDCTKDGETGLLVENTEEGWYNGIKRLIDDLELRASIKAKAFEYVCEHYDIKRVAADLLSVIQDALRQKKPEAISAPRTRLSDVKTPRVLYAASEYKTDSLRKIQKFYECPIHIFKNRHFSSLTLRRHDVIVVGKVDESLRKKLAEKARQFDKKIIMLEDSTEDRMMDEVMDFFFKENIVRDPKPYKFSFRLLRMKLKPYRNAVTLYLFKKTGLKGLELFFREKILKSIKKRSGKVFRFSSAG